MDSEDLEDLEAIMALACGEGPPEAVRRGVRPYKRDGIGRLLKLWTKFAGEILKSPDREIQQATPLETDVPLNIIKSYLWWRVKYGKGRIDGKAITVQTLRKEFYQIARHIARQTDKTWSARDFADIKEVHPTWTNFTGGSN
ncbi:hypothetical protein G6514_009377 [Epicoccum nigrum]|nr:hypothetical protein G6514_009377 [Epicoccum nigrum]